MKRIHNKRPTPCPLMPEGGVEQPTGRWVSLFHKAARRLRHKFATGQATYRRPSQSTGGGFVAGVAGWVVIFAAAGWIYFL